METMGVAKGDNKNIRSNRFLQYHNSGIFKAYAGRINRLFFVIFKGVWQAYCNSSSFPMVAVYG